MAENRIKEKCADDRGKQHHQIDQSNAGWCSGRAEYFYDVVDEWHCAGEKNTFAIRIVDAFLPPEFGVVFYVVKRFIINLHPVTIRSEISCVWMQQ